MTEGLSKFWENIEAAPSPPETSILEVILFSLSVWNWVPLSWAPAKKIFGNDGGIYFSQSNGSAEEISSRNFNYVTSQFYTIGVAPSEMFKDLNKQITGRDLSSWTIRNKVVTGMTDVSLSVWNWVPLSWAPARKTSVNPVTTLFLGVQLERSLPVICLFKSLNISDGATPIV